MIGHSFAVNRMEFEWTAIAAASGASAESSLSGTPVTLHKTDVDKFFVCNAHRSLQLPRLGHPHLIALLSSSSFHDFDRWAAIPILSSRVASQASGRRLVIF